MKKYFVLISLSFLFFSCSIVHGALPLTKNTILNSYDAFVKEINIDYPYFSIKLPGGKKQWDSIAAQYRNNLSNSSSPEDLYYNLEESIVALKDPHIFLDTIRPYWTYTIKKNPLLVSKIFPSDVFLQDKNNRETLIAQLKNQGGNDGVHFLDNYKEVYANTGDKNAYVLYGILSDRITNPIQKNVGIILVSSWLLSNKKDDFFPVWDKIISYFKENNISDIILDSLSNGGGYSAEITYLLGHFVKKEIIYGQEKTKSGPGENDYYKPLNLAIEPEKPYLQISRLTYLANKYSASASEYGFAMVKILSALHILNSITISIRNPHTNSTKPNDPRDGATTGSYGYIIRKELPNGWFFQTSISLFDPYLFTLKPDGLIPNCYGINMGKPYLNYRLAFKISYDFFAASSVKNFYKTAKSSDQVINQIVTKGTDLNAGDYSCTSTPQNYSPKSIDNKTALN